MTLFDRRPIRPMLAVTGKPFDSNEYLFEPKWDGLRALLFISSDRLELQNRNLRDVTRSYPELQGIQDKITAKSAILDGEIVVLNDKGLSDFGSLQHRFGIIDPREAAVLGKKSPVTYVAFDLLHHNGKDLVEKTVSERKETLKTLVHEGPFLLYSDHVKTHGKKFYELARKKGFEGAVAKKLDSVYLPGVRSSSWVKMKGSDTVDCVIVGYTEGEGARSDSFGSLVLALPDKEKNLKHLGNVGGGFGNATLQRMKEELVRLKRKTPTITGPVEANTPITWVKPVLVCEVEYGSITRDRKLRFPRFKRLRTDLKPEALDPLNT